MPTVQEILESGLESLAVARLMTLPRTIEFSPVAAPPTHLFTLALSVHPECPPDIAQEIRSLLQTAIGGAFPYMSFPNEAAIALSIVNQLNPP